MDTNVSHGSATIYQFPKNGRAGLASSRAIPEMRSPSIASTEFGSGWYHDAEIRESGSAKVFTKAVTNAVILPLMFPPQ
jgi:hypothetical protein